MKTNLIKKLTSRKFWVTVSTFVSMLIVALGYAESTATQVAALIVAGGAVVAYIFGEGYADAAGAGRSEGAETVEDDKQGKIGFTASSDNEE